MYTLLSLPWPYLFSVRARVAFVRLDSERQNPMDEIIIDLDRIAAQARQSESGGVLINALTRRVQTAAAQRRICPLGSTALTET